MNARRLYRCRHDRQLAGVASGLAEYFDVDPTIVRVLWIVSVFFGGFTILLYLILAVVMPLEPLVGAASPTTGVAGGISTDPDAPTGTWTVPAVEAGAMAAEASHQHRPRGGDGRFGLALGVLLVAFGSTALVGPAFPGWVAGLALGPAFVIALGVALVVVAIRRPATES